MIVNTAPKQLHRFLTIKLPAVYRFILAAALACFFGSCKKEKQDCPSSTERTFSNAGFTRISAGETFVVNVTQGAAFNIVAKGCANDVDDLELTEQNNTLHLRYKRYKNNRYRVDFDITVPALSGIALDGAAVGTLTGFSRQNGTLRTIINGAAKCTVNDLPVLLNANVTGTGELTVLGSAPDLIAQLSGAAKFKAYGATFSDVDLYVSGTAKAQVHVQKSLSAFASDDSRIYYKGSPASVSIEQSGTAKVIHE